MALVTPTTQDISDNVIAQLEAELSQTIPLLPKSFLRVLSRVFGAVWVIQYKYTAFMFQQIFVATATIEETEINGIIISPLTAWGNLIGAAVRGVAVQAELQITIIATAAGGNLDSGTLMLGANGVTYQVLTTTAIVLPSISVDVRAVADQQGGDGSGEIGNLVDGSEITFVNAVVNLTNFGTVTTTNVQGEDAESVELFRQRIIQKFSRQPQGGALADYREWAVEVAGIGNAFPYANLAQPGQVDVFSETDSGGIPSVAQLTAVFDSIDLATRRPVSVVVNSIAITIQDFDVEIDTLVVDNEADIKTQIEAALNQYFDSREPFIEGLSVLPRLDRITQTTVSAVIEEVVSAAGGTFLDVIVSFSPGGPVTDYTLANGEKSALDVVSYI